MFRYPFKTMKLNPNRFSQESLLEFKDGEVIFHEGQESRDMYIVQQGEVLISKKAAQGEVLLATLTRGDFCGEMSLLESLPRSATARARGVTRLLAIQPGGFLLKIRRDPTFAFEMLQILSGRIRMTNERLVAQLRQEGIVGDKAQSIAHAVLDARP